MIKISIVFAASFALIWSRTLSDFIFMVDLSALIESSSRMLHGQWPYRDFYIHSTPGTFFTQSILWQLFGETLYTFKTYQSIVGATITTGVFIATQQLAPKFAYSVTAVALAWSPYTLHPIPWYTSDADAIALFCGTLLVFNYSFLGGLLAGLSVLFLQSTGVAVILAGLLFLAQKKIRFLLGAFVCVVLGILPLVLSDSFGDFLATIFHDGPQAKIKNGIMEFVLNPIIYAFGPINKFMRLWLLLWCAPLFFLKFIDPKMFRFYLFSAMVSYVGMMKDVSGFTLHSLMLFVPVLTLSTVERKPS